MGVAQDITFPPTFWWGTAASSTQCEGAAPASDWIAWERAGRAPASGEGNGFATRYAADFALFASYGLTHHRLSIEWARIEPRPGWRDPDAVEHHRRVLVATRAAGVHPWVCLHHFTLPAWFTAMGGFLNEEARTSHWRRHVAFCGETFGDLVYGWKPINEPVAYATMGYLWGMGPPGVRDLDKFLDAYRAVLLAQAEAWRVLRGAGRWVATIHNLSPLFPADDSAEAQAAAENVDRILWQVWMQADREGVLALPGRAAENLPELRGACDLIGFSYYHAQAVRGDLSFQPYPPDARVGPLGYAPWSAGLAQVLRRLDAELPGRALLICEHGVGTPVGAEDEWRQQVLRESLRHVAGAIADGIDVRGFFHWTGVDNYEWHYGYDVAFGLFNQRREPRGSADLLARYAQGPRAELVSGTRAL